VQRIERDSGGGLRITDAQGSREQWFDDASGLVEAQTAFERHLTALGWTLVDYVAERRSGSDRRRFPRDTPDRRQRIVQSSQRKADG
jgi:hypothetical protein